MKKHARILAPLCIFLWCWQVAAFAQTGDVIVRLQIGNPVMQINDMREEIDAGRGTEPVIIDGRTLVPIRAIIEAFDGKVIWEEATKTVILILEENEIRLGIHRNTAYLNGEPQWLSVPPTILQDRTMLPIRFIAEGFNLGVAWEDDTKTVTIIRNEFDEAEQEALSRMLPVYSGNAFVEVNQNKPFFKPYEIINGSFEFYGTLDKRGRCEIAFASLSKDTMPTGERESLSEVTPTGWQNATYAEVPGKYLYNRCHLIGFQLCGENANERNLITGTRFLNVEGMLPFENQVDAYIEATGNQVMYRVTPVFSGDNLVADGVLMEAYSVEDEGRGISFCVYCYNVQPRIGIDYATGKSWLVTTDEAGTEPAQGNVVYRTPSGKRYHLDAECGGKNSYPISMEEANENGLTPCAKCAA